MPTAPAPEPLFPPPQQRDDSVGFAKTSTTAKVRIVNIDETEPTTESQSGFARSGKYAQ
jgi:hypothetical protein